MGVNSGLGGDAGSRDDRAAGGTLDRLPREGIAQPASWDLAIIDLLPGAVYACEAPSGLIVRYNRRAAELWGREPALGVDGERFCGSFRIYRPDGTPLPHDQCPMAIALREGRAVQGEEIIVERPDGARFHVLAQPVPLFGESGEVVGAVNTLLDVTERRRDGWERNLLAAIVESTDDAIVSKSLDGVITSWNKAAERIFGYDAAEIVGRPISIIVPPEQAEDVARILDQIHRGKRIDHYETRRRCKDGHIIDVALTISPIRDDSGRIIGASKVARDITERRRIELDRERLLAAERHITEKLRGLADVATRLAVAHEIPAVMQILTEEARALIGAHRAAASLTVDEDWARAIGAVSFSEQYVRRAPREEVSGGPGLGALVCGRNQPIRLAQEELEAHPVWRDGGDGAEPHRPLRGWPPP